MEKLKPHIESKRWVNIFGIEGFTDFEVPPTLGDVISKVNEIVEWINSKKEQLL